MRLCVIGDPVGHSLSPLLHRQMLARAGLTGSYETVTVTPDTLPEFLAAARAGAWDGCNVTMPLKQAILPLLDELDPAAAVCGAVNTVCFRRGRAAGYNTDAPGIRAGLLAHGADPRAGQVLIIGNGGAARAARFALGDCRLLTAARHGGDIPLDRLLLETDAPYMAPVPHRGKRNDSSLIPLVAEKIGELRGLEAQAVLDITAENAARLFGLG